MKSRGDVTHKDVLAKMPDDAWIRSWQLTVRLRLDATLASGDVSSVAAKLRALRGQGKVKSRMREGYAEWRRL